MMYYRTPETYIILLTNVTPVNSMNFKKWHQRVIRFKFLEAWLSFRKNGIVMSPFLAISFLNLLYYSAGIHLFPAFPNLY